MGTARERPRKQEGAGDYWEAVDLLASCIVPGMTQAAPLQTTCPLSPTLPPFAGLEAAFFQWGFSLLNPFSYDKQFGLCMPMKSKESQHD